jgi:hypothetical protein
VRGRFVPTAPLFCTALSFSGIEALLGIYEEILRLLCQFAVTSPIPNGISSALLQNGSFGLAVGAGV